MKRERKQPCPVCGDPRPYTAALEFLDETGFVCDGCGSNVFYGETAAA